MTTVALDAAPTLRRPTGAGVAVAGLLRELAGVADLDVVGYGITGTGWRHLGRALPTGVRPARGPMPARPLLDLWARADHPVVERWCGRLDVVHGTNFVVPPSRRAARLVTVHDLTPVRYPELCAPASLRYPHLVRRAVQRGAHVHTWSRFVAGEVCEHFDVPPERVHAVAPGVDALPEAGPGAAEGPAAGAPYVLGLGTVEPRKDFPLLVEAFDRIAGDHPDLRLRIAGPPGWGEVALDEALERATHRERVERLGWVDDPGPLLAGASVFVYPSRYEGWGFPPLEAMARGVPVVATAAGSLPEVLGDAADLIPAGDADALAGALERVLVDQDHRAALIAAGRERVAGLSWQASGAAFVSLYRSLGG